jgi:hypothetical protein
MNDQTIVRGGWIGRSTMVLAAAFALVAAGGTMQGVAAARADTGYHTLCRYHYTKFLQLESTTVSVLDVQRVIDRKLNDEFITSPDESEAIHKYTDGACA